MTPPVDRPLSPDGHWFWDGSQWRPAERDRGHQHKDRWLTIGAAVLFLVLAAPVSWSAWAVGSGHSLTDFGALGNAASGCDAATLQPDGPIGTGRQVCGNLRLGSELLGVDCGKVATVQDRFKVGTLDSSGQLGGSGTVAISNGSCVMTSPKGEIILLSASGLDPQDSVVVTDFTPPSRVSAIIGLQLRCGQDSCLDVDIALNGHYQVAQLAPDSTTKTLHVGNLPSGGVRLDRPNRLFVRVQGQSLGAYLNGSTLYSGFVPLPAAQGAVQFYNYSISQTDASIVKLGDMHIYRPG